MYYLKWIRKVPNFVIPNRYLHHLSLKVSIFCAHFYLRQNREFGYLKIVLNFEAKGA